MEKGCGTQAGWYLPFSIIHFPFPIIKIILFTYLEIK